MSETKICPFMPYFENIVKERTLFRCFMEAARRNTRTFTSPWMAFDPASDFADSMLYMLGTFMPYSKRGKKQ